MKLISQFESHLDPAYIFDDHVRDDQEKMWMKWCKGHKRYVTLYELEEG
jgi:hypothetical protein